MEYLDCFYSVFQLYRLVVILFYLLQMQRLLIVLIGFYSLIVKQQIKI